MKRGLVGAAAAQAWQGPTGPGMQAGGQEGCEGGRRQAPSRQSPCCPEPAAKQPEGAVGTRKPSSRGIAQVKGPGLWGMQGARHVGGQPCLVSRAGLPTGPCLSPCLACSEHRCTGQEAWLEAVRGWQDAGAGPPQSGTTGQSGGPGDWSGGPERGPAARERRQEGLHERRRPAW